MELALNELGESGVGYGGGRFARIPLDKIQLPPGVKVDPKIVQEFTDVIRGKRRTVSPEAWFADFTYLRDNAALVVRIRRELISQKYIPFIELHPRLGWVFHSMSCPDGTMSVKKVAEFFNNVPPTRGELLIEDGLSEKLKREGRPVRRQVKCRGGVADIVTDLSIYEIKDTLTHNKIFRALGQVSLYRQAINPSLKPCIVGRPHQGTEADVELVKAIGVEVILWTA